MSTRGFWELEGVSDDQLRQTLVALLASGYRTEARIIAHLAELEERRLHAKDASESLFAYSTKTLGLSNSEAFHRITAARVARQFPAIFELIERRELHLTAVCLLRDYLTEKNHRELLAEASRKTKWQVQELIARRFPRPDVASRVRKLPALSVPAAPALASPVLPALCTDVARELLPAGLSPASTRPVPLSAPSTPSGATGERVQSRASIEPTSEARYRIQLTASSSLKKKLDLASALLSHSNPGGDIAVVIERALDLLIEKVQKQRFGTTERPRRSRPVRRNDRVQPSVDTDAESERSFVQTKSGVPGATRPIHRAGKAKARSKLEARRREHIPNATRREIAARDGLRCTFVAKNGCRCEARAFLQIHHEKPWALGGGPELENLRLLCAPHNRLLAEQDFGAQLIAQRIAERSPKSAKPASPGE